MVIADNGKHLVTGGKHSTVAERVSIPYKAWARIKNIGDAITPYIVNTIAPGEPVLSTAKGPHLLGIGSIFHFANPQSQIWGSGILDPTKSSFNIIPSKIHAVRGKLTLERLRKMGYDVGDVPLGDPGILIGRLPEVRDAQVPVTRRASLVLLHRSS